MVRDAGAARTSPVSGEMVVAGSSAPGASASIRSVLALGQRLASGDDLDQLADPVDHGQHGADQLRVGAAAIGADIGERILGGMAEGFEAGEIEEAAIALDRVDEAENVVEPGAVLRLRLPGDDLPAEVFQHVPAFRDEIGVQIVHGPTSLGFVGWV